MGEPPELATNFRDRTLAGRDYSEGKHVMPDEIMCVVLSAGRGTRMQSDLPKVLHRINGKTMIMHVIEAAQAAGAKRIVAVVGHGADLVQGECGGQIEYGEQRGTGHAVMQALPIIQSFRGDVLILYGDMPLIAPATLVAMIDTRRHNGADGVIATATLENPPDFGRVIRNDRNQVSRVVEVRDATDEEMATKEVNVSIYCFQAQALVAALSEIKNDNAQGEYYLTNTVEANANAGGKIVTFNVD